MDIENLTQIESKIFHKMSRKKSTYPDSDGESIETLKHWFRRQERDIVEDVINGMAADPDKPLQKTDSGKYILDRRALANYLSNNSESVRISEDEIPDNVSKALLEKIRNNNKKTDIIIEELKLTKQELKNSRQNAENWREEAKRIRVISLIISVASFLLGFLSSGLL
jgi:hypothetical protein